MMLNFANSPFATPPLREEADGGAEDRDGLLKVAAEREIRILNEKAAVQSVVPEHEVDDVVPPLGLWGPSRPPGEAENRVLGVKRRWTVTEAGS